MFYTVSRKSISLLVIIILVIITPIALGVTISYSSEKNTYTIVIDAGHGGIDEGVHGITTGVSESELNLIIAKELRKFCSEAGFNVVMTRSTSGGLYGIKSPGFKSRDMKERKRIIRESGADMVISIHMNNYTSSARRGAQVFYSNNASKDLAKEIQRVINLNINSPLVGRNLRELYGDYYILQCTDAPSVIIECGFMSSPEDEKLLLLPEYQKELAYYIFTGIMNYSTLSASN